MKYPHTVPMPRDVEDWLEGELETRGMDAVVGTPYIVSRMQQSSLDNNAWSHLTAAKVVWGVEQCEKDQQHNCWDYDLAVVRCLMSASTMKCDIESRVDELRMKLKEIQGSANGGEPSKLPLYSGYNSAHLPLLDLEYCGDMNNPISTSAWTRGILRASLERTDTTLPYKCAISPDRYSRMYCGPINMYQDCAAETSTAREDIKRLYERSVNVAYNLEPSIHDIWNPEPAPPAPNTFGFAQNQAYFYNNHKLFSPTIFSYGNTTKSAQSPVPAWSLGGPVTGLPNQGQNANYHKEVVHGEAADVSSSLVEEEDLLTSARTHFRPIRSDDLGTQPLVYEDGTTFAISTELKQLQFQRSESGTLYLDTGKYMEFKKDEGGEPRAEEFVPKFRVRQSNEKFCQTEDVGVMTDLVEEQVVPESPTSPVSDPDEFFFPGDDELALDLNEDLPAEEEVAQIVSGRLAIRWKAIDDVPLDQDAESSWHAENAALVDDLVDEDTDWKEPTDDQMEGVSCENDRLNAAAAVSYWPQLTDSIWNTRNPAQACETCNRRLSTGKHQPSTKSFMTKPEWQEIWGKPTCDGCKESDADSISTADNPVWAVYPANEVKPTREPFVSDWNTLRPVIKEDEKDDDFERNVSSPGWQWPKLNATLSAYLEESRLKAFEMLSVWSPGILNVEELSARKPESDLRDLWSPIVADVSTPGMSAGERHEVWSPIPGPLVDLPRERPFTYCLLRDELSEDGDQLLSDLSYLHLQQLGSGELTDDDSFPTMPPSPGSDRFVRLLSTCNLIEVTGENNVIISTRTYNSETAQKERKRRHSSSQKVCELFMEGECRRPHCRFLHEEDASPTPLCAPPHVHRSFTL